MAWGLFALVWFADGCFVWATQGWDAALVRFAWAGLNYIAWRLHKNGITI